MNKNSLNLSDNRFVTHNCNGYTFKIGDLNGSQPYIELTVYEALELKRFLEEELYEYGDRD